MAQSEAQGGQNDKRPIQNSRANLGGTRNSGDPGDYVSGNEVDVNAKIQNRLSPPLPDRAAALRTVANPLFRLARPVELGNRNGQVGSVGKIETECSVIAPLSAQPVSEKDMRTSDKLSTQFTSYQIEKTATYTKSGFKRSRIKKGWLIKRLAGYSIAETEYGVSYLWVVSRDPDRTSADKSVYGFAGYFNWKGLEASGLLRKEKKTK